MKHIFFILILAFSSSFISANEISVQKIDENNYVLSLSNNEVLSIRVAQSHIIEKAKILCGKKFPVLGKYSFKGTEAIEAKEKNNTKFEFIQNVKCTAKQDNKEIVSESKIKSRSQKQEIEEDIRKMSIKYLNNLVSGNFDEAYFNVAESLRAFSPKSTWMSKKRNFTSQVGKTIKINISKVSIYDNPANAPRPGIYVAADYYNEFANAPIHCGYLMWFKGDGNFFQIIREESGFITTEQVSQISKEKLPIVKQRLRCVSP